MPQCPVPAYGPLPADAASQPSAAEGRAAGDPASGAAQCIPISLPGGAGAAIMICRSYHVATRKPLPPRSRRLIDMLFVTGEGLGAEKACKTNLAVISPAAAGSPVFAQQGVEQEPLV